MIRFLLFVIAVSLYSIAMDLEKLVNHFVK